jgi:hypothetical protein
LKILINISVRSLDKEDLDSDNISKNLDDKSESINIIKKFILTADTTLSYLHLDLSILNILLNYLSCPEMNISIPSNYNQHCIDNFIINMIITIEIINIDQNKLSVNSSNNFLKLNK